MRICCRFIEICGDPMWLTLLKGAVKAVLEIVTMENFPPFCVFFLLHTFYSIPSLICEKEPLFKYLILVLLFFLLFFFYFYYPFFLSFSIFLDCKISSLCYTLGFAFQCETFVCQHVNMFVSWVSKKPQLLFFSCCRI